MGFQGQRRGGIAEPRVSLEEKLGCWACFFSFVFRFWPMKVIAKTNKQKTRQDRRFGAAKLQVRDRAGPSVTGIPLPGRERPASSPRGSLRAVGEKHVPQPAGLEPARGAPRGSRARALNRSATTTRRWEPRTPAAGAPGPRRARLCGGESAGPRHPRDSWHPRHTRAPTPPAVPGEFRRPLRALGPAPRAAFRAQFPGGPRALRSPSAPTPLSG